MLIYVYFAQMDKLLLLSEGYPLYYGDAHVCPHWFAEQGQPVPFGEQPPFPSSSSSTLSNPRWPDVALALINKLERTSDCVVLTHPPV